jgi:hypothetical protein
MVAARRGENSAENVTCQRSLPQLGSYPPEVQLASGWVRDEVVPTGLVLAISEPGQPPTSILGGWPGGLAGQQCGATHPAAIGVAPPLKCGRMLGNISVILVAE